MALAAAGDTNAFNQLVVRWERPIYTLAFRVLGGTVKLTSPGHTRAG